MLEPLNISQWIILLLCGLLIGFTKTGVPGLGLIVAPLMAWFFPARISTAMVLPALIIGDVITVAYYRRHAVWPHLIRLIPWVIVGIIIGWRIMAVINDAQLKAIISVIVFVILGLNILMWTRLGNVPTKWWFAAIMGIMAGITTMLANAAGPIMTIYLLSMGLKKNEFIGTGSWYYLIGNTLKVPFSIQLGLLTWSSVACNLVQLPLIVLGTVTGIWLLKRIADKSFRVIVQLLAAAAAVRLLF
ncbi:sulfite exporter TauE/SafE family protein [Verrucomicrobiota bacterium]